MGFCHLYLTFSSLQLQRVWVFNNLYVYESARKLGMASALMDTADAFARSDGACELVLEAAESNAQAHALYESRGWHQIDGTRFYELSCS